MFLEEVSGRGSIEFIVSEKQICQGKYIYPSHTFLTKFVSRGSMSLLLIPHIHLYSSLRCNKLHKSHEQAHWETETHFTATGMSLEHNQSDSFHTFHFNLPAFYQLNKRHHHLKSKV